MINAVKVPQLNVIAIINFKYCLFLNNLDNRSLYFILVSVVTAIAALLGGSSGFSLKNITNNSIGIVTRIAYIIKNVLISEVVEFLSIKKLGPEAPIVIDIRVAKIPVKVTIPTFCLLNQLRATLLGVLRIKIFPMAAKQDPKRQYSACPTSNNSRSQTPAIRKVAPTTNEILIPYLLISQLQGKAKRGCAMVKSSAFSVTQMPEISNFSETSLLILEKV